MNKKLYLPAFLLTLAAPLTTYADICDDINDMADGWNEMADGVEDVDLYELTRREIREIDDAIGMASEATQEFAELLQDEGSRRERRLGRELEDALDYLYEAEHIEETVDSMDLVVDALDDITDYCDE